jgi:cytochrome c nitrite reductase small subunit
LKLKKAKWWHYMVFTGAGVSFGLSLGMGTYTFYYAKGSSYLTNDPKACLNCHIMREQYDGWISSSHRSVASCNDCHAPHSLILKFYVKAKNGFFHSYYFTTGTFNDPIRITDSNRKVTEQSCRHCHQDVVHNIDVGASKEPLSCINCHRSVGHMH